jgi:CRP-like cAMP-binding protein
VTVSNHLLAILSPLHRSLIEQRLEPVSLPKGTVLIEPGEAITHAYFLDTGLGSVVAVSPEPREAEVGIIGRDGAVGTNVIFGGDRTPIRTFIQIAGQGHRIAAAELRSLCDEQAAIRNLLLCYADTLAVQVMYTALSNTIHSVEERLARWLLMSHDRVNGDELPLTHDFLALMLAVRRPSVTTSLHILEGGGLIRATRGLITIRDRGGLEDLASDAYGVPESDYERRIGPLRAAPASDGPSL